MTAYDDWGYPTSSRNHFHEPLSLTARATTLAKSGLEQVGIYNSRAPASRRWNLRRVFSLPNFVILLWIFYLRWGERTVFRSAIQACDWSNWESWPQDANPHHLVFVADPQLVDPHTYPGRPWPLSTLTVAFTDQYLRRSFSLIQTDLYPDTIIFLGDLFDGGREWTADGSISEDTSWKKYGDKYWLREYDRFGSLFFGHWPDAGMAARKGQEGRKIIASLPGNHDLGFATGIRPNVRKRFNTYFGDGNRVDVIGNHTFVSVDTVSLSALGHATGSETLWKPTQDFLDQAQEQKKRAVSRELLRQQGLPPHPLYDHVVLEGDDMADSHLPYPNVNDAEFPTILLSHVPLYRAEGTPCGPLREHWPPTEPPKGQKEPVNPDERNAIPVRGGYQYQNVLTRQISKDITEKVGHIEYAFSGDDHDYCEVVHMGYPSGGSGIREITVKSLSWAMGVRKPGFLMVSMWNPVDHQGNPLTAQETSGQPTIQTHLCLLPDQLSTFIRYGFLLGFSLSLLIVRATILSLRAKKTASFSNGSILPTHNHTESSAEAEKAEGNSDRKRTDSLGKGSSNSSDSSDKGGLSARSLPPRSPRNPSPTPVGGYGLPSPQLNGHGKQPNGHEKYPLPLINYAGYYGVPLEEKKKVISPVIETRPRKKGVWRQILSSSFMAELGKSLAQVALVVLAYYFWLLHKW
ncbi:hypothetical protein BC567DRAFT_223147 [Phyllosticta citribraziliensis]